MCIRDRVMGAYGLWFPDAPIRTLIFIVLKDIKAKWWLGFWFISQFFTGADSGVAWMAHVGGFVFGAVIALLIRQSPRAQDAAFTSPYQYEPANPWDSTGGAGAGPYAEARRFGQM